ncbi:MAG: hypothetical protein A2Y95_00400 [Deltaproteobacteria bacterium RBG_13_65_10]|nr:MAG: hypothetical protein A2Y95_00400 [Deltaproteobacteria bacterium RBG_13_65_10]
MGPRSGFFETRCPNERVRREGIGPRRRADGTAFRRFVNAALLALAAAAAGCGSGVHPTRLALQWEGWSLRPSDRVFKDHCLTPLGRPRWAFRAGGVTYRQSDYGLLGNGDGTLDLAPRHPVADATPYPVNVVVGPRLLEPVMTPQVMALSPGARGEAFVRLYLEGGGVLDAKWVKRGEGPEAKGADVLGQAFHLADDTITLAQGHEVVPGMGSGRVALRVTSQDGNARIDYGLNAALPRDRDGAEALTASRQVVRIATRDLDDARIGGRGLSALPGLMRRVGFTYPLGLAFTGPPALFVSLESILFAPFSRPATGARLRMSPEDIAARVGESGIEDGKVWITVYPPEGSERVWAIRGEDVRVRWQEEGRKRSLGASGRGGAPTLRPLLLDPAQGTRLYFFGAGNMPDRFELLMDGLYATDGTEIAPAVYEMARETHVRWNPISVWRGWMCH